MIRIDRIDRIDRKPAGNANAVFRWHCPEHKLAGKSRQPLLDACRKLAARGLDRSLRIGLYRQDRAEPDATCSIAWGAAHTVADPRRASPHFAKWKPLVETPVRNANTSPSSAVSPPINQSRDSTPVAKRRANG